MKTKKWVFLSLLTALGLVLGLFESQIPLPIPVPGARLGLSNMVVLITISVFGYREGFAIALLKSLVLVLITGGVSSFIFSFTGALLSSIAMILAHKFLLGKISLIGISEIGSFFHNFGQIAAATFVLKSSAIFAYFPLLVITGIFTGYFVGLGSIYGSESLNKIKAVR